MTNPIEKSSSRREFMNKTARTAGFFLLGGVSGKMLSNAVGEEMVWQINPEKCLGCGKCATACVLTPSASRVAHDFEMCGYCRICSSFFPPDAPTLDEGAENQLCPVGALARTFIEEPYYEYDVDRDLCIGCARCSKGCNAFGNGSLYMQVQRDLCVNCNKCAIATVCDGQAFERIPASRQYLPKGANGNGDNHKPGGSDEA